MIEGNYNTHLKPKLILILLLHLGHFENHRHRNL